MAAPAQSERYVKLGMPCKRCRVVSNLQAPPSLVDMGRQTIKFNFYCGCCFSKLEAGRVK